MFDFIDRMDGFSSLRRSGNVYNRPSYGAVGNAVCRLWESSFYFSMGCERRFPWRNGRLCTFPLRCLFCFPVEPKLRPFHRPAAYQKRSRGTRSQLRHGAVRGIGGLPQQAVLRSKTAECVPLCLACHFCPEFGVILVIPKVRLSRIPQRKPATAAFLREIFGITFCVCLSCQIESIYEKPKNSG